MYLKFIWQSKNLVHTVCLLPSYPDVKYVRLGYIGTCNMEHIGTPPMHLNGCLNVPHVSVRN